MQAPNISVDNTKFCRLNRKLPPILLLQMDNCVGDKKKILLASRRVFDIVEVGFPLSGIQT
jgi:hypothetical protein